MIRDTKKAKDYVCMWCGRYYGSYAPFSCFCSKECRESARESNMQKHAMDMYCNNRAKLDILNNIALLELDRMSLNVKPKNEREAELNAEIFEQIDYYRTLFMED